MASAVISYAGWSFLPGLVSGWIQTVYYGITIRAGDPKPQPGTPRFLKHRRNIQMTVIVLYLLYTLFEADYTLRQQGDFFQTLGVGLDSDDKKIKSRFRRLAAKYHPDKLTTDDPMALASAETHFVLLKQAQDTLSDPVKRFAYERFGADILEWQHCVTMRDYLMRGLQIVQAPIYAGSATLMVILSFTSYLSAGRFWRYVIFCALAILEFHTVTRPYYTPVLERFINPVLETITTHPPLLPYQLLVLARKATFTLFIAFSQLSGLLESSTPTKTTNGAASVYDLQQLSRLEQIAGQNDAESSRLLAMDMAPFAGDEQGTKELRGKIREWLVNNTIRADPEVRDAVGRSLAKRRVGAPPGAKI